MNYNRYLCANCGCEIDEHVSFSVDGMAVCHSCYNSTARKYPIRGEIMPDQASNDIELGMHAKRTQPRQVTHWYIRARCPICGGRMVSDGTAIYCECGLELDIMPASDADTDLRAGHYEDFSAIAEMLRG